jgi:hypothetical protein
MTGKRGFNHGMGAGVSIIKAVFAATLTVVVYVAGAAVAQAAPELTPQVNVPKVLVPGQAATAQVTFTNTGDTVIGPGAATDATITTSFPSSAVAPKSVSVTSGRWSCEIVDAPPGKDVVCDGPVGVELVVGASNCTFIGVTFIAQPCSPITIAIEADPNAPKGSVETVARGCATGGSVDCPTAVSTTTIQDYGDNYGIAPINQPGVDQVEVISETDAFWAGSCDRAAAPAFGVDIPLPGQGTMPSSIWAPGGDALGRVSVPAPTTATHCIDVGEPSRYLVTTEPGIWFEAPDWRLPALTQAGSRPDGSTTLAWRRNAGNEIDGAVDNVYVDLPSGFVGNPNGLDKCTQEEFAAEPPQCSPASQAGVLQLLIKGRGLGGSGHGAANYKIHPVWNLEPRTGRVAELGFAYASGEQAISVRLSAKARTNGDFGVTAFTGQIPVVFAPMIQTITLWGVPWDSANDLWRAPQELYAGKAGPYPDCIKQAGVAEESSYIPNSGFAPECRQSYDPSWGEMKPFISQETDCNTAPVVTGGTDSYQNPGSYIADGSLASGKLSLLTGDPDPGAPGWKTATSAQAAVTGCEKLGFAPDIDFTPSSSSADGATGLKVDLAVPQNNTAPFFAPPVGASQTAVDEYVDDAAAHWKSDAGLATAHLKDTVVTLPAGVSVNPSAATGLTGCDDATIGVRAQGDPPLFDNSDPTDGLDGDDCPDGSRLGTARVETALLDEPLTGDVVLGTPKSTNPQSGEMLRLFLVLRDKKRGLVAKVYGTAVADPNTGRITATFKNNPEIPFDRLSLDFKGGSKGVLALPRACGNAGWATSFTPWSAVGAVTPVADRQDGGVFAVNQNCANGFSPSLAAGMDTQAARSSGTFSFRFSRNEGEQYLRGLTAKLPKGLLASVKDVPLCTNGQANAGACPAGSKIGLVDAKAGSGDPFVLEEKGEVFLTEGYKGGEYGLAVKIRPIAGPFRGAMELSPIVVRQAIHVDRTSAQVTAVSDPFPLIHHGVPLRVREVTVLVNRGGFMLNPSDCAAKQVTADIGSDQGSTSSPTNGFQAAGCKGLAFKPKLALRLTGRKQVRTGKHPGIRAVVTQQGVPEAGIEKAEVRLPKSLALDVNNAQALCEFADGTKPDLESHCPKGSIVGRARAVSPLLNGPLVGNVYFVKNVRIDPGTGNTIRTLPMIVVALRGEISVNLKGQSDTTKSGKLVNTFDQVPDAPVTKFNLNIRGGSKGIIAVTRTRKAKINLCASGRQIAEADIDGHNGRRHDRDIRMKTPCTKKQTKNAKRAAKHAAVKAGKTQRAR